ARFLLELPGHGIFASRQQGHVGAGLHRPYRRRLPVRAPELSGVAGRLPLAAIPEGRCERPYDDRQQSHRAGPKGHRHGLHQAQGSREIGRPRACAAIAGVNGALKYPHASPLRIAGTDPISHSTATLMLDSSGAGTTTEWLGSAGCTRALCSWSLAFLGVFWPVRAPFASRFACATFWRALASPGPADIRVQHE